MSALEELKTAFQDINALRAAGSLMNWDRTLFMPPKGAEARSAQATILSRMAHEHLISDRFQNLVGNAAPETEEDQAMIAAVKRELDTYTKLPSALMERKTKVGSDAYEVWKRAKADSNFSLLEPYFKELVEISIEMTEHLGYEDHPYDALINLFELGATHADAAAMFETIKQPIVSLVKEIRESGKPVDDAFLVGDWDSQRLRDVAQEITAAIGYDYDRGRLDVGFNAFCMNMSMSDVRMTTRPSNHVKGILSSSLHEMGHGLYEQGSPEKWDRTPLAGGISLAVHESQSRTWENVIGRSRSFWSHFLPTLQKGFPQLGSVSVDEFYRCINKVQPELIRVGADELTYNLHILTRFELESDLITRKLNVKDLPEAWNAKHAEYLGLTPPNDALGCLQDVHWTRGMFGYFPTYSMGNLIGAQIWATLIKDVTNTEALMASGDFKPILGWLQENIYSKAKTLPPKELIIKVTGRPMESSDWLTYVDKKYRAIYEI